MDKSMRYRFFFVKANRRVQDRRPRRESFPLSAQLL